MMEKPIDSYDVAFVRLYLLLFAALIYLVGNAFASTACGACDMRSAVLERNT